jgi:response regulator of citrate/malate metabolism
MIRTLVIEDEPIIAEGINADLRRVAGFTSIGVARTGRQGKELAGRERPDLVLLDFTLPDMTGFEVWRFLHGLPRPPDVIAVTAACEGNTVRSAIAHGAIEYLVKPFSFAAFRDRLERYADYARRLPAGVAANQEQIVCALGAMHGPANRLPSGLSPVTLGLVIDVLRAADRPLSATEVAQAIGRSRVCARRHLEYLHRKELVTLEYRCDGPGHPVHLYRWAGG